MRTRAEDDLGEHSLVARAESVVYAAIVRPRNQTRYARQVFLLIILVDFLCCRAEGQASYYLPQVRKR